MTQEQYNIEKLKIIMGGLTLREFYNKVLKSFYTLETALNETPSLFEELMPKINHKVKILECTKNLINAYIRQGKIKGRTNLMSDKEILEGFNC